MSSGSGSFGGRALASLAVGLAVLLAAGVLVSQTRQQRTVVYVSPIPAPEGADDRDAPPPPSPLEIRAAVAAGQGVVLGSVAAADRVVPEVPWDHNGLARAEVLPEAVRWDEVRERYVADLADGRTAILTLSGTHARLIEIMSRFDEPAEAGVVIEPDTGRVLALADDFSLESIGPGLSRRADAVAASTFKVVTGFALLTEGAATPETETCFSGGGSGFDLDDLDASRDPNDSCLSLIDAMAWSANLVFARLADRHLDPETLQGYADAVGFNATIPFEMPLERSRAEIPEDRLEFARSAAGFRHTWLTPLHAAMIVGAVANDGQMMVPTVVESIEDAEGNTVYQHRPTVWREVMTAEVAEQLTTVLSETAVSGTARRDFSQRQGWPHRLRVWGKTGTLSNRVDGGPSPDPTLVYRWFAGFGQWEERRVAGAGLVVSTPQWWIKGTYLMSEGFLHALL